MTQKRSTAKGKKMSDDEIDFQRNMNPPTSSSIRLEIKFKNERQKQLANSIKIKDVTICTGFPGTGKTFIACAQSLLELKNNDNIKKIVLVKSVTTLKSEEIGFLKGTMMDKMEPFMYSFMKNFEKLIGVEKTERLKLENLIEIIPIAYMRGINIDNAVIIIDECQNITIENIRTILSRLGENSKMILLGDLKQIDTKNKKNSALKFLLERFNDIEEIGIIEFLIDDIVRHPLIKKIEPIFEAYDNEFKDNSKF
jgi:phosphate starvation-inducible PhoH-like protein